MFIIQRFVIHAIGLLVCERFHNQCPELLPCRGSGNSENKDFQGSGFKERNISSALLRFSGEQE